MEDIQYKLACTPIPKQELLILAYCIRMANFQLNVNPGIDSVSIEGYLQTLDRNNKGHIYNLVEERLKAYGLTMQDMNSKNFSPNS